MKFVVDNLVKSYGKDSLVLDGASFEFEEGKIYGLLGRNGSGKTTLFNCINGDIPYNSGWLLRGSPRRMPLFCCYSSSSSIPIGI